MRLHSLSVTAFGPFPGTEQVDFDELNEAGLFLLTGPTGAGKTSILDAVCFALYGSVPGVRGVKTLKSQHAEPQTRPEVQLDFSIGDRRFLVRRSPEWARPKLRGSGLLTEKASATLVETSSGADHLLSSRAQEVGHQICELIGMNAGQFAQVAMLPQGEFQRFLRATSQERHDVLQHLFKTDRFARIEDWVADHSRSLRDRSSAGEATVRRILDTVAERTTEALPDELADLSAPGADELVLPFMDQAVRSATETLAATRSAHDLAAVRLAEARGDHQEAERVTALLARLARAREALAAIEAEQTDDEAARAALEADRRATRCLPVLRVLDDAAGRLRQAEAVCEDAVAALAGEVPTTGPATTELLTDAERELRSRVTRIETLLPREAALVQAREDSERAAAELEKVAADRARAAARIAELPVQIEGCQQELADARRRSARGEALTLTLHQAELRSDAARRLAAEQPLLTALQDACRDARDRKASARDHLHEVVARRLAGIAAELAGRLEDGRPCQVCGSVEHPLPATPTAGSVTEEQHDQASAALDSCSEAYDRALREVAEAERRLDALRQTSGDLPVEEADEQVRLAADALAEAQHAERRSAELAARLEALLTEQRQVTGRVHELDTAAATLAQQLEHQARTVREVTAEIAAVTGVESDTGAEPLSASLAHLGESLTLVTAAGAALSSADGIRARVGELESQAATTVTEQGFDDVADARAAILEAVERERLEREVAARNDARAAAVAALRDDEVASVVGSPAPDVTVTRRLVAEAELDHQATARDLHKAEDLMGSLVAQQARLATALTEWVPAHTAYARAESMSRLVRGMGTDNQLQMRLSAYVLATRLDQVVDAANERLAHMRDQRYLLQRTGRAARKGSQAGLGLEVVDQWTGDVRDPTTLSGGETFVVSLSLALGLADVVSQEAGGSEIHTLFVDEGFGTLDADTLDDVMDRLDGLRAGGRTVGVVSHVTELRNRIPTQVHVDKQRTGSTIAVRTLVG